MGYRWIAKGIGIIVGIGIACAAQAAELTISAAASMSNAFRELGPMFETLNPGTRVLFNFAASDALLAQIDRGAPADVFASADQQTMDRAQAKKLLVDESRITFVGNRLVVVTPMGGAPVIARLADLGSDSVKRIAIGQPGGVPAGRYAKDALEAAGLWAAVEPKLIFAQNVRQALDYVARGEVEAGFVYATDAALLKDKVRLALTVPTTAPITCPIAVVAGSANAALARRFVDFVTSGTARPVFEKYGFVKP